MRKQGREERNPMQVHPQATKLGAVPFLPSTVKTTLKAHWQIRGQKGLWRFVATTAPESDLVEHGEIVAWFYPNWSGQSVNVTYGRFYRDRELENVLKKLL
jgi:hypothetical protein